MSETVFSKIIRREIPADIVYEDDDCLAFKDIAPKAPVHLLVIPKKPIVNIAAMEQADQSLVGHLFLVIQKIAIDLGFADDGYRVITNSGKGGGQEVFHLHFHVLSGGQLPGFKQLPAVEQ